MSVERNAMRELDFLCDGCSEVLETQELEFGAALSQLDGHGWKAVIHPQPNGRWHHYCPECSRDFEPVE